MALLTVAVLKSCSEPTSEDLRCCRSGWRGGHVIPGGLLRRYRAITLRERECNQRRAARKRKYVFTCLRE